MSTFIIVISIIIALAGVVGAFMSRPWAAVAAFIALLIAGSSEAADMSTASIMFWLVATAIVTIIVMVLPRAVSKSSQGVAYIAAATLAGVLLGMIVSHAGMITGAVIGALLGSVAYCFTPAGRSLGFPGKKAVNYLCAKAFPVIITMCMVGELVALLSRAA